MQKIKPAITKNGPVSPDSLPGYHYATGPPNEIGFELGEESLSTNY